MEGAHPVQENRRRVLLGLSAMVPMSVGGHCAGASAACNASQATGAACGNDAASMAAGPGGARAGGDASSLPILRQGLPAWAESVPVMQWARIAGTNLSRVDPKSYLGATGPRSKIDAWCGAGYSRLRRAYIIAAAGGHGDYANNEVNVIRLDQPSPVWEEVLASSPASAIRNGLVYEDGRRASTHSYWGTQYIEYLDRTFLLQCYGTDAEMFKHLPRSYPASTYIMAFNHATGHWDPPDHWARWPNTGTDAWFGAFGCQNVLTGEAYAASHYDGGALRRFDGRLNRWTTIMRLDNAIFSAQAVDPRRNRILQVGAYQRVGPKVIDLNARSYLNVSFRGLGQSALTMIGTNAGMVFDELNDCFYVFPGDDAAQVLRVRASDWHVDRPSIAGTSPGKRVNGWQNAWQYDPALKGIVCAIAHEGDMVYLRTSA
jgi:hypothetical protein